MNFAYLFLIPYMSIASRLAGGGVWPKRPPQLPEILFSLPFAWVCNWPSLSGFIALFWTYGMFQLGHAVAFHMGAGENYAPAGRKAELSLIIDPLCRALQRPLGGSFYCWTFMGLKGLLVALPLGWWALAAAVLWPSAYYVGNIIVPRFSKTVDGEMVAEYLSGAVMGVLVLAALANAGGG